MRGRDFFYGQTTTLATLWKLQLGVGAMLVVLGLLVAAFPEILVALIAAGIVVCGAAFLASGWSLRRLEKDARVVRSWSVFEW